MLKYYRISLISNSLVNRRKFHFQISSIQLYHPLNDRHSLSLLDRLRHSQAFQFYSQFYNIIKLEFLDLLPERRIFLENLDEVGHSQQML